MPRTRQPNGFTLVELLIVLAILALLAAIVLPTAQRAMELSRRAMCQTNLRSLSVAMITRGGRGADIGDLMVELPMATDWDLRMFRAGAGAYMECVSVPEHQLSLRTSLSDIYVRQDGQGSAVTDGVACSNLYDVLALGEVNDRQLHYTYGESNNASDWDWVIDLNDGQELQENQAFVSISTCAAFLMTITDSWIEFKPLGHHPNWNSGSSHWICQGDDEEEWYDDVLVRLTGVGQPEAFPPVKTKAFGETDYGMNNLVPPVAPQFRQLLLTEYSKPTIWLSSNDPTGETNDIYDRPFDDDYDNGEVVERHLGAANAVLVDGSVRAMTKAELEAEFMLLDEADESMWRP